MIASFGAYVLSFLLRLGPRGGRPLARLLAFTGYGVMTAGAYVGGDLVFRTGNQVDRHAFDSESTKWKTLDVREVPAGTLVKAKTSTDTLVLYRPTDNDPITALHATCSHAGGPLDKGTIVDGCVECPWHASRFALADGRVRRGPAVYDQPIFEIRETDEGKLEARRVVANG
jgi:nitrite reductase/ring-hydroxylating ferredoxin subunit